MLSKAKTRPKRRLDSKGNLGNGNTCSTSNSNTLLSLLPRSLHSLGTVASRFSRVLANSIPVLSIFALVGITIGSLGIIDVSRIELLSKVFPSSSTISIGSISNKAYAESMDDTNMPTDTSANVSGMTGISNDSDVSMEESITPYATEETIGDSTASITISGSGSNEQVEAGYNTVTYRTHNVRVQASNINSYTLNLSGPSILVTRNKDGSSITNGNTTTIKSANGATGAVMASNTTSTYDNTWGYGYSTNTSISNENMTYTAPVASSNGGTNLNIGGNSIIDTNTHNLDSTIKLAFAIKFGDSAIPGRYYDSVVLSLVATPRVLTTYSITYNGNGNTGGSVPTKQEVNVYDTASYSFTVPSTTPTKTGYNFIGWSTSSTATSATYKAGDTVTLTSTKPAITLYAVWEVTTNVYKITYNCNGGDNCPSDFSATSTASSYTAMISTELPRRSGYKFLGYTEVANPTPTMARYSRGQIITLLADSPSRTFYAQWGAPDTSFPDALTRMQNMTTEICANVAVGTTKTLTDSRDSSTYIIAKLSDGNCWMTQNLRLAGGTAITSTNSDLNGISSYTLPAATTGNFSSDDTIQQMRNSTDNDYGAYYSWCAATANTCQSGGIPIAAGVDATSSICPKGWKLPKGGSNGDFRVLYTKYPNAAPSAFQTNNGKNGFWLGASSTAAGGAFFPAAGYVYTSGLDSTGTNGYYWSRTANSTTRAYYLSFNSTTISPAYYNNHYYGFSVRCVAYSS